jgi:hypothetical protein
MAQNSSLNTGFRQSLTRVVRDRIRASGLEWRAFTDLGFTRDRRSYSAQVGFADLGAANRYPLSLNARWRR